ncbi:hypothetical protein ACTMTF_45745 [Nonomuraea sp. ZG12]|uniref:hypothetical protein n=1 Tax=Nonomuraea sp. ZG12 TaxID=3452207 RepID=UPI003F8AD7B3
MKLMKPDRWDLTQIIGLGGALVGYLGLGVAIWNIAGQVLPLVVYVLLVFVGVMGVRIYGGQKELKYLENKCAELTELSQQSADLTHLAYGLSASISYLAGEPRGDYSHHYTQVIEEYAIHGDDGTYIWTLRGYNATSKPSEKIGVKFIGDRPMSAQALDITVVDLLQPENDLKVELVTDLPHYKSIAVFFGSSLPPQGEFALKISCRWNETFTRERRFDYVMFVMGVVAARGVDRMTGRLICDLPIVDFRLEECSHNGLLPAAVQPHQVDSTSHRTILEWHARDPKSMYLLRFHKGLSPLRRLEDQLPG